MTREEAVNRFKGIRKSFSISIAQSKFYPSKAILNELCDMAIEALDRQKGEWVDDKDGYPCCSECGFSYGCIECCHTEDTNYCPNCGADMRGDTE